MKIKTLLDMANYPDAAFKTSDGRTLEFISGHGSQIGYTFELTCLQDEYDVPFDPAPMDGIECRLWVPDSEGQVWMSLAYVTAEYFLEELAFASFEDRCSIYQDVSDKIQRLFESSLLLRNVNCYERRDFGCRLFFLRKERLMGSSALEDCWTTFDIAVDKEDKDKPVLYVRMNEGVRYNVQRPFNQIGRFSEFPALLFELKSIERLWSSNGARCQSVEVLRRTDLESPWRLLKSPKPVKVLGPWRRTLTPEPLIFQPIDERDEPQSSVRVL